MKYFAMSTGIH